jgi:hypothetical protein
MKSAEQHIEDGEEHLDRAYVAPYGEETSYHLQKAQAHFLAASAISALIQTERQP